ARGRGRCGRSRGRRCRRGLLRVRLRPGGRRLRPGGDALLAVDELDAGTPQFPCALNRAAMARCQHTQQDAETVWYRGLMEFLDRRLAARAWRLYLLFALAIFVPATAKTASAETKRILILNSFGH